MDHPASVVAVFAGVGLGAGRLAVFRVRRRVVVRLRVGVALGVALCVLVTGALVFC
ncbi:MAG TPA: hypothetical protein VFR78_20415 [Pyrinomonadaceae bacterium]|nr:hypothetical protein [Pyrinomonadaceae bacterium]